MSIDIGYGLRRPEDGDNNFWDLLEDLFDKMVNHSHDGSDTPTIDTSSLVRQSVILASGDWVPTNDIGYTQSVTCPAGVQLDSTYIKAIVNSGPNQYKIVNPTIVPISLTTFDIIVNDNSLELKLFFL